MGNNSEIVKPSVLLVEGSSDKKVIVCLLQYLEIQNVQVMAYGGKNRIQEQVRALLKVSGFSSVEKLGVIRDADDSRDTAFESLSDCLTRSGLGKPPADGTLVGSHLAVGVFILPDNNGAGELEDLLLESVVDSPPFQCVEPFGDCVSKLDISPKSISKSKALAYVAAMPDYCHEMGVAAQKGYWNFDADCFEPLKRFLSSFA